MVPAIKHKWPDCDRVVVIQQDGASPHIFDNDLEFCAAATQALWNISLVSTVV